MPRDTESGTNRNARRRRACAVRGRLGIGVIVTIHLAALAALLSTEYGPFAITLSLLAWAS